MQRRPCVVPCSVDKGPGRQGQGRGGEEESGYAHDRPSPHLAPPTRAPPAPVASRTGQAPPKWKVQRDQLRAALRAGREATKAIAEGPPRPAFPPASNNEHQTPNTVSSCVRAGPEHSAPGPVSARGRRSGRYSTVTMARTHTHTHTNTHAHTHAHTNTHAHPGPAPCAPSDAHPHARCLDGVPGLRAEVPSGHGQEAYTRGTPGSGSVAMLFGSGCVGGAGGMGWWWWPCTFVCKGVIRVIRGSSNE